MVDRKLFPDPPRSAILVPSPVPEVESFVRIFWRDTFKGDPAFVDSFWSVVPGTKGYCAAVDYRSQPYWPPMEGIPSWDWSEHADLQEQLGRCFSGRRNYGLIFLKDHSEQILAHEYSIGDSNYYPFDKLREIEPGIPADPWDFAESRGVVIERWPEPEPPPPVRKACVIEDVALGDLAPFSEGLDIAFQPVSRGMLVIGHRSSDVGIDAAYELKKTVYLLRYSPTIARFECLVYQEGDVLGEYQSRPEWSQQPQLDSVLGETTPRGILRALEVPPELLDLEPDSVT